MDTRRWDVRRVLRIGARTLCGLLLALSTWGCRASAPTPPSIADWTLTITFTYDFTNFPVCSATVTKGCVSGFNWGYIQSANSITVKTSPTTICAGTTQPLTCTDTANTQLGIGPTTYFVDAVGVDNNGAAVTSVDGTSAPDNIVIGVPTTPTVTRK